MATQAAGVAVYGLRLLEQLAMKAEPEAAIAAVLRDDEERETRQLGVVTADGRVAAFTGERCLTWAGHVVGPGVACQGNILAGEAVVADMARAFTHTAGQLAERLVTALEAGQAAGGDRRGQQSAAVIVERVGAAAERRDGIDRICDLRVDDHEQPIAELRRLLGIHQRWDLMRRSLVHYEQKDYEQAIRVVKSGLARFQDDGMLLYTLACYESQAGRRDDALVHLSEAVQLDDQFRIAARDDEDFASLRADREFRRLTRLDAG